MLARISLLATTTMGALVFAQVPAPTQAPAPTPANSLGPDQGGAGDLLIAPTRLIIEKGQRTTEVALFNQGAKASTYRISVLRTGMTEDGSVVDLPEPPAGTVDPTNLFRFSPHEIKLEPGETQIIRIALRKPADLPDGEYRVHLRFVGLPPVEAPQPKPATPQKGLSATITPVFGVSIPLIFRQGNVSATAKLSGLYLDTSVAKPTLKLDLGREGNASLYGDFKVLFTPTGGASQPVGELNGLAVYTPLTLRHVAIGLNAPKGVELKHGTFAVTFLDGKGQATLATATLAVP